MEKSSVLEMNIDLKSLDYQEFKEYKKDFLKDIELADFGKYNVDKNQKQVIEEINKQLEENTLDYEFKATSLGTEFIQKASQNSIKSLIDFGNTDIEPYIRWTEDCIEDYIDSGIIKVNPKLSLVESKKSELLEVEKLWEESILSILGGESEYELNKLINKSNPEYRNEADKLLAYHFDNEYGLKLTKDNMQDLLIDSNDMLKTMRLSNLHTEVDTLNEISKKMFGPSSFDFEYDLIYNEEYTYQEYACVDFINNILKDEKFLSEEEVTDLKLLKKEYINSSKQLKNYTMENINEKVEEMRIGGEIKYMQEQKVVQENQVKM